MTLSLQEELASKPKPERREILEAMSDAERAMLAGWGGSSRPEQREPENTGWTYWAMIGGRGSGKTRAAAEWVCDRIEGIDNRTRALTDYRARYVGFIGRSSGDVRRVMLEGESGFFKCCDRRGIEYSFNPSRAQATVRCRDGHEATVTMFSAEEPESLRGPQHDTLWADEFAAWARKVDSVGNTAFTNAQAGLRLSEHPKGCFSTTPKVSPDIKAIFEDTSGDWIMSRMATWDNTTNLAPTFIALLRRQHPTGSRLAQQEFEGMLLEEVEGALWTLQSLDQTRLGRDNRPAPPLIQRAVAVDPSVQWQGQGDECGIVGGGLTEHQQLVVMYDYSVAAGPDAWAAQVARCAALLDTKTVVAEGNQGGALVESVLRNHDPSLRVEIVMARDSKRARAEPVAQLWDTLRAGIYGSLPGLEGQLTGWSSYENESPDRLDALAWLGHWAMKRMFYLPPGWAAAHHMVVNSDLSDDRGLVPIGQPSGRVLTRKERLAALAAHSGARRRRMRRSV